MDVEKPKRCNEDSILTNRPDIVTDVTIINQVNIESDHRMVMSNIKPDITKKMNITIYTLNNWL